MTDLFGEDDIISTYTDAQAIEDGVLVDLVAIKADVRFNGKRINRMTSNLYGALSEFVFTPDDLRSTIRTKLKYARDTAEAGEARDVIYALPPNLWLVANEVGGWTLMFPEDF